MCFVFLYRVVWNIYHSNQSSNYHKCTCLRVKYPLFLSDFNETWIFLRYSQKIHRCQVSWKTSNGSHVVPCGQTHRWTDQQTDTHDETNSGFSQVCEELPKNNLPNTRKIPLVMPISFFAMQWYAPKSEGPTFIMSNCIWVWNYKYILHITSVTLLEVCRFFDCVYITVKLSHGT